MIKNLNIAIKSAIDAMETSKKLISSGIQAATAALAAFRVIHEAAENVAQSAPEVAAASEEQAATMEEEFTPPIHEVASLIETTAKESTAAAAATEESSASVDRVIRMIRELNTPVQDAMEANLKFRVE